MSSSRWLSVTWAVVRVLPGVVLGALFGAHVGLAGHLRTETRFLLGAAVCTLVGAVLGGASCYAFVRRTRLRLIGGAFLVIAFLVAVGTFLDTWFFAGRYFARLAEVSLLR